MSVSVSPGKRSYNVVWKIGKIEQCISNVFSFEGSKWCFVMEQEINAYHYEEDWKMYLRKIHPREGSHVFLVSVYLEDKQRKLECLNFTRISISKPGTEQIMWRRKSNVLQKYPNLSLDKDVSFVITLIPDHRYMTEIQNLTDSKHVQTPAHMEVHPCLESLSTDFSELLASSSSSSDSEPDVRLQCDGQTLRAHKSVLVARSEVFAAMLQSDMLERRRSSVDIADVDLPTLEHFLRYLYTGRLPDTIDIDSAAGLYEAADKYAVHSLKRRCTDFLKDTMTAENACSLLVLADAHSDDSFKDSVISFIIRNDILEQMKEGSSFCALYPILAVDVLYRAYKMMKSPPKSRKY